MKGNTMTETLVATYTSLDNRRMVLGEFNFHNHRCPVYSEADDEALSKLIETLPIHMKGKMIRVEAAVDLQQALFNAQKEIAALRDTNRSPEAGKEISKPGTALASDASVASIAATGLVPGAQAVRGAVGTLAVTDKPVGA